MAAVEAPLSAAAAVLPLQSAAVVNQLAVKVVVEFRLQPAVALQVLPQ